MLEEDEMIREQKEREFGDHVKGKWDNKDARTIRENVNIKSE